ncbi:ABC transporter permease [Methylosinus sporium]|uniref:ABC transporter permease n=1 Tax=Methylosinus sporium TaxID=428 RepID=UPI001FCE5575|nr:ABC transporter permease [Methylosinus sporium]
MSRMNALGLDLRTTAPGIARRLAWSAPLSVRICLVWLAAMAIVAAFADGIMPYDYAAVNLRERLLPPFGFGGDLAHILGTDELGRDELSRIVFSIRVSLFIATGSTLISACIGTTAGFVAAHFRGRIEQALLALVDFQASMPFLILALAARAFLDDSLPVFIALLGLHGWERYARIVRGLTIGAAGRGYAAAVRQLGAHPLRIYGLHILPNVASTLIIAMSIAFPEVILVESSLSFLGLGVQPPAASLGSLIGFGRDYLVRAPWLVAAPAITISLLTLSVSYLGDRLRDHIDGASR